MICTVRIMYNGDEEIFGIYYIYIIKSYLDDDQERNNTRPHQYLS